MIFSESTLNAENLKLHEIFKKNEYPSNIVRKTIDKKTVFPLANYLVPTHPLSILTYLILEGGVRDLQNKFLTSLANVSLLVTLVIFQTCSAFPSFGLFHVKSPQK